MLAEGIYITRMTRNVFNINRNVVGYLALGWGRFYSFSVEDCSIFKFPTFLLAFVMFFQKARTRIATNISFIHQRHSSGKQAVSDIIK